MLDAAIKIIDRLISLVKERQSNNRKVFEDHIEPLFLDMTSIQRDYRSTFDEISERLRHLPIQEELISEIITKKKPQLESLRTKVNAFSVVVEEVNPSHFPKEAVDFINACAKYFRTSAGRSRDYYGHYSELIDYMNREKILTENKEDRMNNFGYKLYLVITQLSDSWNEVTFSYAAARVALLR